MVLDSALANTNFQEVLVEVALFYSGMQVHFISVGEHIWVGGGGPRGVGELPAGGIRASQGTFSRCKSFMKLFE